MAEVTLGEVADTPGTGVATESPTRLAIRRFARNRLAVVGAIALTVVVLVVVLAPWTAPYDPLEVDFKAFGKPPSAAHPLGTDGSGRDVLSRVIWGGRVSLGVGFGSVALYLVIGTIIGAVAGYARGVVDGALMRVTDVFLSLPTLIIVIALVPLLGPSMWSIIAVLALFGWPITARLVRGEFLALRERDFVVAARSLGASPGRIVRTHILPNIASPLVVVASFGVADAVIIESGLSLLGLGIQAPDASWGQMLQAAADLSVLLAKPWIWMAPAAALAVTVLAINFVGDGLRDAFDPRGTLGR